MVSATAVAHLTMRRFFVFLDEWLTYGLLIYLFLNESTRFVVPFVAIPALGMNFLGYHNLKKLRIFYGVPDV